MISGLMLNHVCHGVFHTVVWLMRKDRLFPKILFRPKVGPSLVVGDSLLLIIVIRYLIADVLFIRIYSAVIWFTFNCGGSGGSHGHGRRCLVIVAGFSVVRVAFHSVLCGLGLIVPRRCV